PKGEDSSLCEIHYEQPDGEIPGRAIVQCLVRIKADKTTEINDLSLPCYLLDTDETIYLNIKGVVKGISVEIFVSNDETYSRAKLIDFENVQMGSRSSRQLIFQNMSGIRTSVNLNMKNFKAFEMIQEKRLFDDPCKKMSSLIDRFKLEDQYIGIGFGLEKSYFELPEFSSVTISVVAIADFWGLYEDTLSIEIDGIDKITLVPVKINITGSPVKLYTGKVVQMDDMSMVRFGSSTQGQKPVVRKVQMLNTSLHPVNISWKIFLVKSPDDQLIDVNLVDEEIKVSFSNSSSLESNNTKTMSRNSSNFVYRNNFEPIEELRESMCDDYYYSFEERFPLVKINLTPHYGQDQQKDNQIFSLDKHNLSLDAKEKKQLEITFNTHAEKCGSYEAIFVGYLSLPDYLITGDGFSRKISFEKEPVIFKATGCLQSPNLLVEYENEDLSFVVSTGDLIDPETKILKDNLKLNSKIWLLNNSLSPVDFNINVEKPFSFNDQTLSTRSLQLKSKAKIQCSINFDFNFDFVSKLNFGSGNSPVFYEDSLWLNFANNLKQRIPISVKTYPPHLVVTTDTINFGKILIDQQRHHQFWMRNHSFSSAIWNIKIVDDSDEVFQCDLTQGFIESRRKNINKCEQLINVYFNAKCVA
ncbi:Deleted in lung and esophageal cancer 1, partial [Brachionus plicatilis]